MGEYFKPWRRKIGVVTLVMACVVVAGWVRGRCVRDFVDSGRYLPGSRGIVIDNNRDSFTLKTREGPTICLLPGGEINTVLPVSDAKVVLVTLIRIPYWSIFIPLTLLSAYLLFSKPRVEPATAQSSSVDSPRP